MNTSRVSWGCLLISLLIAAPTPATHFRFGHLTWKQRSDLGPTCAELTFTSAFRRNGYSGTFPDGFPQTGDVIRETIGSTSLCFGDGPCTGILEFTVTSFDPDENWLIGEAFETPGQPITHCYPAPGDYLAFSESCCRISECLAPNAHINNDDGRYRIETVVNLGTDNSSPVSSSPPIVLCPEEGLCSFPIPASDNELDLVTYRLANGVESELVRQPGPPDCPSGASVDAIDGVYFWDTSGCRTAVDQCGNPGFNTLYSTQVVIEDGESKVPLDFFIQLVPCPPDNTKPAFQDTPCGDTLSANPDEPLIFEVQATDADVGDLVKLNASSLPVGAVMTPQLPVEGNPATSTFSWTPQTSDVGQRVMTFTASDVCGLTELCSVTVDVSGERCSDGDDNDGDGLVDCDDPDCALDPECLAVQPLLIQDRLFRGFPTEFRLLGGEPGEVVIFAVSTTGTGSGPCFPALGGLCVDLLPPITQLGQTTVGPTGIASITVDVPAIAPLGALTSQAVISRGVDSVASNTVLGEIEDLPLVRVTFDNEVEAGGGWNWSYNVVNTLPTAQSVEFSSFHVMPDGSEEALEGPLTIDLDPSGRFDAVRVLALGANATEGDHNVRATIVDPGTGEEIDSGSIRVFVDSPTDGGAARGRMRHGGDSPDDDPVVDLRLDPVVMPGGTWTYGFELTNNLPIGQTVVAEVLLTDAQGVQEAVGTPVVQTLDPEQKLRLSGSTTLDLDAPFGGYSAFVRLTDPDTAEVIDESDEVRFRVIPN